MRIKTLIGKSDSGMVKYRFSAHIFLEYPTMPIPLKVAVGIFREENTAEAWATQCLEIMGEDQSWADAGDAQEMDTWLSMHLPPDDFEREHAQ
jgi:hypothetical protein